jgi:hypothetical protein
MLGKDLRRHVPQLAQNGWHLRCRPHGDHSLSPVSGARTRFMLSFSGLEVHTRIRQKGGPGTHRPENQGEDDDRVGMARSSRHETTPRRLALRERG